MGIFRYKHFKNQYNKDTSKTSQSLNMKQKKNLQTKLHNFKIKGQEEKKKKGGGGKEKRKVYAQRK